MNRLFYLFFHSLTGLIAACFTYAQDTELAPSLFADHNLTPSPACLAVSAGGAVYVGIDLNGSLGKGPGRGRIVRLRDHDQDGVVDEHCLFAEIDHPRGLVAVLDTLYVLHARYGEDGKIAGLSLSSFTDRDDDGIADGPPRPLVENLSTPKFNRSRGVDHSTNGIQMGIDGWIYLAVGDFGMVEARGSDGKTLTLLGGGVVRVRPDGSELELYSSGFRNIYDLAIDPCMNLFTRGNTNDGVGWWVRFSHHLQSGDYGYPSLYTYFTDEIIPALADLGRGSGTGALFLDEPAWKDSSAYQQPLTADWGRSMIYAHHLTPDGASFRQSEKALIAVSQPSDMDVDASGQLYLAAWEGAGYKGSPQKGAVYRVVPPGWSPKRYQKLEGLPLSALYQKLGSNSLKTRLEASQLLLAQNAPAPPLLALAQDDSLKPAGRIAALYTYVQLTGPEGFEDLFRLMDDPLLQEHVLRAGTDRLEGAASVSHAPYIEALQSSNPRTAAAALIGIGRIGDRSLAPAVVELSATPPRDYDTFLKPEGERLPGAHALPAPDRLLPHLAVQTLRRLEAVEAALVALDGPAQDGALWALRTMPTPTSVAGLIEKLQQTTDRSLKLKLMDVLARLYSQESPYRGKRWWNTKPDPHGPYYWETTWSESPRIAAAYRTTLAEAEEAEAVLYKRLAAYNKAYIPGVYEKPKAQKETSPKVGATSIENVVLALGKLSGSPQRGKALLKKQACAACHYIEVGDHHLGPDLHHIGAILGAEEIAEAILKPAATIAENWVTASLTSGIRVTGTLVSQDEKEVTLRDIAGTTTRYPQSGLTDIAKADHTIMGPHLLDALNLQEFVDLTAYLASKK